MRIKHSAAVELQPDGRVFLVTYSEAENGARILDGLPLVVPSMDDPLLGTEALAALERSNARVLPARDVIADPPDREFLQWVGKPSFGAYARGVRRVSFYVVTPGNEDGIRTIKIAPAQNLGGQSGFTAIAEAKSELAYEGPDQLGDALREAMKLATA